MTPLSLFSKIIIPCLSAGILTACGACQVSTPMPEPDPAPTPTPVIEPAPTPTPTPVEPTPEPTGPSFESTLGGKIIMGVDNQPVKATFYFDLDKAVITSSDLSILSTHAELLVANQSQRVVIAGHCDERGTRQYNLALGERRANAVRDYLISEGVSSSQIETISYGEERPVDSASNETAYAKNRRAELHYP